MPLMGLGVGGIISNYFLLNVNLVVGVIFFIIGIEMFISSIKNEDVNVMISFFGFLLFGFSVSIDSFTTGIGLSLITNNYILASIIFMFISSLFTFVGLSCGNILSEKFGSRATMLGGIIMIILSGYYIF